MKKIKIKKGQILQRKGDLNSKVYQVQSGLLRSYSIDEKGKEHIYLFAPENWIIADSVSPKTPCDLFIDALEDDQKKGLLFFFNDGNCALCHKGPTFSDWKLTVHGAKDNIAGNFPDFGANNAYQFKTPTLRNIELTAPYTHGGMYNTLEEALGFYNTGESDNPNVSNNMLDDHIEKINLVS